MNFGPAAKEDIENERKTMKPYVPKLSAQIRTPTVAYLPLAPLFRLVEVLFLIKGNKLN